MICTGGMSLHNGHYHSVYARPMRHVRAHHDSAASAAVQGCQFKPPVRYTPAATIQALQDHLQH
jgi:hypothetical protein